MATHPQPQETVRLPGAGERMVTLNVIFEENNANRSVRVLSTPKRLKVYLEMQIFNPQAFPSLEGLEAILAESGVASGVDAECLSYFLLLLRENENRFGPMQVAAGRPAEPGRDGFIDWYVNPSSEKARYQTDEKGKIDYHETHLIENAVAGEKIAVLLPPTRGQPGLDVFGADIPTAPGKPCRLRIGPHVEFDEPAGVIRAAIDGRVVFDNHLVSITGDYVIDGDVDLSVGHIDFVGDVIVNGQVLDDFTVRGKRSVTVHGGVGAAQIESEGEIVIDGGFSGKGRGAVKAGPGTLRVKYINEVRVESFGDVEVQNEAVNTVIHTTGTVRIPRGSIIGGEVSALRGVEAETLGSSLGVVTRVSSGVDWTSEERLARLDGEIQRLDAQLEKLKEGVLPLLELKDRLRMAAEGRRTLLQEVLAHLKELRDRRAATARERTDIQANTRQDAVYQINVSKQIHPGVLVRIGSVMGQIRDAVRGPVSIVQHRNGEIIQNIPYKNLPGPADPVPPAPAA